MNRRDYLLAGAGLGTAGLAGCSFLAAAEAPPPDVPKQQLNDGGWTRTDQSAETVFDRNYGPVSVEAVSSTVQYVDEQLQARVADRTLDQVQTALSVFFATRVDFSPNLDNLPAGVGRKELLAEVRTNARDSFEQQMEAQGLTDIEKSGEGTIDIDTGETAETVALSAVYPFEGISFDVTENEVVEIPASDIDISAMFAVWHHGDFVIISGGAYPAQNFAQTVETDLSDGITVTVDVDLGLQPDTYQTEVRSLVAGVQ
ncbi:hypothetical protein Har1130_05895 [Haloarcula sp. CBA1130]|uniref:DUF6517 family protein n=1 Tax=unclassified Haloarcula TaxID=2624677 RepID=UPI0012445666|nr:MULTISPECIES: DUF6517 family protein [unclassified Haloarcula]KAA9398018.1 hypothetical protein Har1129_07245 [Haloarcula sp. CBA1129]KAA9402293.1 hypothetical protein Har1130_05895 [Haloarcula sp. CBA1130]